VISKRGSVSSPTPTMVIATPHADGQCRTKRANHFVSATASSWSCRAQAPGPGLHRSWVIGRFVRQHPIIHRHELPRALIHLVFENTPVLCAFHQLGSSILNNWEL